MLTWDELSKNERVIELRAALAVGRQLPLPPPDAPTPFALSDPARVLAILTASGFDRIAFEPIDESIEFGSDTDDAFAFMRTLGIVQGLTHDLDSDGRAEALAELRKTVAVHEQAGGVLFGTSAWLITARRM